MKGERHEQILGDARRTQEDTPKGDGEVLKRRRLLPEGDIDVAEGGEGRNRAGRGVLYVLMYGRGWFGPEGLIPRI